MWPREYAAGSDVNASSIVVRVSYGEFDAVLSGDADEKSQPYTTDSRHVEVFKVPHHGAKTAINKNYLDALAPEVSIISVGAKNIYGHPSADTISLLKNIGSKVYRTDKNGTVEITSDGKSWEVKPEF